MDQHNAQQQSSSEAKKPWGKYIFVALIVVLGAVVWFSQRRGPSLEGWSSDLTSALEMARQQDRRVLAFFHQTPMSASDRRAVNDVLSHRDVRLVLEYEKLITVRLSIAEHAELTGRLGIEGTPAFALLGPDGEPIRVNKGYLSITQLADFLDSSVREARESLSDQ